MDDAFAAAERFVQAEARLLEQRLFARLFHDAPAAGVADALRGYRNADGGFGHGLEPDKRCPVSLPLDVETALQTLATAGATDPELLGPACDFLARTAAAADAGGAVALASPVIEAYPRAVHLTEWTYQPALNPTAGLTGLLYRLDADHPWREEATRWCWRALEDGPPVADAHTLSEVLVFLAHVPDRDRADRHAAALAARFAAIEMLHLDPHADGYGLTPLQLAPTPDARWRSLFTDDQLDGHLDRLQQDQRPDGGWPITWDPPSAASRADWRGMVTVQALHTLTAYGRVPRQRPAEPATIG